LTLNALECRALCHAQCSITQDQRDSNLVTEAHNAYLIPVPASPSIDNYNPDVQDIPTFIHNKSALLSPLAIVWKKGAGITYLLYENQNGPPTRVSGNGNVTKMEVDLYAFNEHKINSLHLENCRASFGHLFNEGETLTKAIGGNNMHFGASVLCRWMEGGMVMVAYGELASLLSNNLSGMDSMGLGHWTYMTFTGSDDPLTTILVDYHPCKMTSHHPSLLPTPLGILHNSKN
jgi:hypothetical protein